MKKIAIAASLTALTFLGWIAFHRVEVWVIPGIEIIVTDRDGRPLAIERSDVTVKSDETANVTYEVMGDGHIAIRPKKIWKNNSMGDPYFETLITIAPEGYKSCLGEVGISTGQTVGSLPPQYFQVHFRLAEEGSDRSCEVETHWIDHPK